MIYRNQTQQQADAIAWPKHLWYDGQRGITVLTGADIPFEKTQEGIEEAEASIRVGKLVLWGGTNTLPPFTTQCKFTPGTSGLIEAGFVKGTSTTADLLLVYNSTLGGGVGGWDQYFFSNGGLVGIGWRKVGAGSVNQTDTLILPGSVLQLKRIGTTPVALLWQMP
tara:strand:- start:182 stop:679 length:498 start_codon:yes stop_codon:yes gene_type:complete